MSATTFTIRELQPSDAEACDAIIAGLPYFFGEPTGVSQCAEAVRNERGFVATDGDDVVGFITYDEVVRRSVEMTWLAVRNDLRRSGIGRELVARAVERAAADGARIMCVLTAAPDPTDVGIEDGYEGTRTFYERVGFVPVRQLDLASWNTNEALLFVRPL